MYKKNDSIFVLFRKRSYFFSRLVVILLRMYTKVFIQIDWTTPCSGLCFVNSNISWYDLMKWFYVYVFYLFVPLMYLEKLINMRRPKSRICIRIIKFTFVVLVTIHLIFFLLLLLFIFRMLFYSLQTILGNVYSISFSSFCLLEYFMEMFTWCQDMEIFLFQTVEPF